MKHLPLNSQDKLTAQVKTYFHREQHILKKIKTSRYNCIACKLFSYSGIHASFKQKKKKILSLLQTFTRYLIPMCKAGGGGGGSGKGDLGPAFAPGKTLQDIESRRDVGGTSN